MEDKLNSLGFKKVFPDKIDKKYFYWVKNIEHSFLQGLNIIVSEEYISVDTIEQSDIRVFYHTEVTICRLKKTERNLDNIINWLTK